MSSADTWFKCFHKLRESAVFKNSQLLHVWIWCLVSAKYFPCSTIFYSGQRTESVELLPGQFIFGRKKASEELGMTESGFYKRLKKLQKMKNVNIESNNRFTKITIVNWDTYQGSTEKGNNESNNRVTTEEQQSNTINRSNKEKNRIKTSLSAETSGINEEENIPEPLLEDQKPEKPKKPPVPVQKINDLYNEILSDNGGLLLSEFPDLVNDKIKARWNMKDTSSFEQNQWEQGQRFNCLEWWESFFEYVSGCDWLMGRVKNACWKADLGWILRKEKFLEILSGKFENKKRF